MSQDLFAAFGSSAAQGPSAAINVNTSSANASPDPAIKSTGDHRDHSQEVLQDDDDDFGDFEDAASPQPAAAAQPTPQHGSVPGKTNLPFSQPQSRSTAPGYGAKKESELGSHPFAGRMDLLFGDDEDDEYNAGADEITDLAANPEAAMAYSKRVIAEQQAEQEWRKGPLVAPTEAPVQRREPNKLRKKSGYMPTQNSDVLFDADDAVHQAADDGFGEFETFQVGSGLDRGASQPAVKTATKGIDLLSMQDEHEPRVPSKPSTVAFSMQESNQDTVDDAWDDFEESPAPAQKSASPTVQSRPVIDSAFQRSTTALATKKGGDSAEALPPTNVPPPSILLSLFPSIFASGEEALLAPLGKLDFKQKQVLLAHPATHMFLRGYLSLAVVLAHIIAGRKLRWKRDHRLAQSMRIGPAAAGGKGGMKLAGVDRGEVAKEEREVLDTLRVWKLQAGKLRSAVVTASASTPAGEAKLSAFPEIAEQMPVRTLKPGEGGMTALHPCALCGLKREERVAKVDVEINDSFGEWWVDGMDMHLLCRNFWEEHKGKLRSR